MNEFMEGLQSQALILLDNTHEFVAGFFFEPFGVEVSPGVIEATTYVLAALAAFAVYRLLRPAPHPRYRHEFRDSSGMRR